MASEKIKSKFVLKEGWDKRKIEGRCMKCGRRNHWARDCKVPSSVKTPLSLVNANHEPIQKQRKFN